MRAFRKFLKFTVRSLLIQRFLWYYWVLTQRCHWHLLNFDSAGSMTLWSFGSAASMTPLSHGTPLSFDSAASSAIWNLNRLGCESVALGETFNGKKLSYKILWDYPFNQWLGCLISILLAYTVYMIVFPLIFIYILWRIDNKYVYVF